MGLPDNIIPEEKLPTCWSDDVRMNALFAPFRIKTANPESWDMKMKFWSDMLRQWCKHKKDPIVSASDAKFAFQRNGRTPACIDIVIEEMFRNGDLCPLSKYQQILHSGPEGWLSWGARLAFRPAAFAVTAVTSLLPARPALDSDGLPKASIESTQRFVLESAVKDQATELLDNYPSGAERIGTVDELMKNCGWSRGREVFDILLGYLVAQGSAVKKGDVIKLAEPNKKVSPVTETDEALVKLLAAETRLEGEALRLSRDVAAAEAEAKAALQLGNRIVAKNHLRRKHKAQARVDRCESALENVRQLLLQMRDVESNAAIVDTYRTSSEAMKRGMKEGGLEEDAVHDTMDDLKDVMDSYNEIEKALGTPVDEYDAAELEEELKELLAGPGAPGGGTPAKEERPAPTLPSPPKSQPRKISERDYVFDCEERVIAELNELSVQDAEPKGQKVALAETCVEAAKPQSKDKPTKPWYPPSAQCLSPDELWNNNVAVGQRYAELRQDDRLHPGQPLDVDLTTPARLYSAQFTVQDHKMVDGVWLYNVNNNDLAQHSTEHISSESPGKSVGSFQMAPGCERKCSHGWPSDEDLEERLRKLRGFNL